MNLFVIVQCTSLRQIPKKIKQEYNRRNKQSILKLTVTRFNIFGVKLAEIYSKVNLSRIWKFYSTRRLRRKAFRCFAFQHNSRYNKIPSRDMKTKIASINSIQKLSLSPSFYLFIYFISTKNSSVLITTLIHLT